MMNAMLQEPNNTGHAGDKYTVDGKGGGSGDPDCVHMFPKDNTGVGGCRGQCSAGAWADYSCTKEDHYICEIRGCPKGTWYQQLCVR